MVIEYNLRNLPAFMKGRSVVKGNLKQRIWGAAGLTCFALGAFGAFVPLFPTTPFLLLASVCFVRSSPRLNDWFEGTELYRRFFANYVSRRAMTLAEKAKIIAPVTVLLAISFAVMGDVPVGRAVVTIVWVAHLVYFGAVVKTARSEGEPFHRIR